MKEIQILGLQRSGTNFLQRLIMDNYSIDCTGDYFLLWKHVYNPLKTMKHHGQSYCNLVRHNLKFMKYHGFRTALVTKNPYFWLESVKRNPVDADDLDWGMFRPDENTEDKVKLGFLGDMDLKKVCKIWVDFHEYWIENSFDSLVKLRYEDLLKDSVECLNTINQHLKLNEDVTLTKENILIPQKVPQSSGFDPSRISRSIEQKDPKITSREAEVMSSVLRSRVLEYYNYSILTI